MLCFPMCLKILERTLMGGVEIQMVLEEVPRRIRKGGQDRKLIPEGIY